MGIGKSSLPDSCFEDRIIHKRKDLVNNSAMISSGTRINKNSFTRALYYNLVNYGRNKLRLSINDIRDVLKKNTLPHSSKTIYHLVKDTPRVKRSCRYLLNPFKVKLGSRAHLVNKWIRYILGTGFNDISAALTNIEQGIEPP